MVKKDKKRQRDSDGDTERKKETDGGTEKEKRLREAGRNNGREKLRHED